MKNSVVCKNCSTENPLYSHICSNCKQYLRDKVSNIDIWTSILTIIESPSEAFRRIVYSEHKNFIIFLLLILSVRVLILARYISVPFSENDGISLPLGLAYVITFISLFALISLISFSITITLNKRDYRIRFKDTLSLNVYSHLPNIFAVVLLFPIELIVFGNYLFSNNPYPFQIKPFAAYVLIGFEAGTIIWSFFLNYMAYKVLTGEKASSIVLSTLTFLLFTGLTIILSTILFI